MRPHYLYIPIHLSMLWWEQRKGGGAPYTKSLLNLAKKGETAKALPPATRFKYMNSQRNTLGNRKGETIKAATPTRCTRNVAAKAAHAALLNNKNKIESPVAKEHNLHPQS